jgi:hypothetical protein
MPIPKKKNGDRPHNAHYRFRSALSYAKQTQAKRACASAASRASISL